MVSIFLLIFAPHNNNKNMFDTFLGGLVLGLMIGAVASIFIYRNNKALFDTYADKVDRIYDHLEETKNIK